MNPKRTQGGNGCSWAKDGSWIYVVMRMMVDAWAEDEWMQERM